MSTKAAVAVGGRSGGCSGGCSGGHQEEPNILRGKDDEFQFQYTSYHDAWKNNNSNKTKKQTQKVNPQLLRHKNNNNIDTSTPAKILDLCWYDHHPHPSEHVLLLLACTAQGEVCVWKIPPWSSSSSSLSSLTAADGTEETERQDDDKEPDDEYDLYYSGGLKGEKTRMDSWRKPLCRWKVSSSSSRGVLYSIQIIHPNSHATTTTSTKELLIVTGDEGVRVLEWNPDTMMIIERDDSSVNDDVVNVPKCLSLLQPHPSPFEKRSIEVNQACYDPYQDYLFGAAGDAFGCYKWNLTTEQLLQTYPSPDKGYLQTLHLTTTTTTGGHRHLLTAGDDGIVGIWNIDQDQLVDQIHTAAFEYNNNNNNNNKTNNNKKNLTGSKRKAPPMRRWISTIVLGGGDEASPWWTMGGGAGGGGGSTSSNNNGSCGGFLATYHEPTRSVVAVAETRQDIHHLCRSSDGNILSVGNCDMLSHWNPWTLQCERETWCSSMSCGYAVAVAPRFNNTHPERIAVGGVGDSIDLIEDNQVVFRLHLE